MSTAHEELSELLQDNIADALPVDPSRSEIQEQVELAVQHVIAAGYRKQQTVTVEGLALELFIADNFKQPREQSIVDWQWFESSPARFRGRIEHYKTMAAAIHAIIAPEAAE